MIIKKFHRVKYRKAVISPKAKLFNWVNKSSESGQTSKIIIILALVVIVIIVIAFGVTKFIATKKQGASKSEVPGDTTTKPSEPTKPIYETTLSDIKFILESSEDLGNVLKSNVSYQKDLTTTERFIRVVIGAQNKEKNNIAQYAWNVGNIVDSDGRNFVSINDKAYSLLPKPDLCGALLKPEFEPIPCVKYYEVSKISTNLKVTVKVTVPKNKESLIDLKFIQ